MRKQMQALIDAAKLAARAAFEGADELRAAVADAEKRLRRHDIDNADEREQRVVQRPDCKPVVWTIVNGKRLTHRQLPMRDDLVCANHQRLALAVLAWFTTENEALAAYQAFHKAYVAPFLAGPVLEFQVSGEQVLDWLIDWRQRT